MIFCKKIVLLYDLILTHLFFVFLISPIRIDWCNKLRQSKVITASADYYIIQAVVLDVVLDGAIELLIRCGE